MHQIRTKVDVSIWIHTLVFAEFASADPDSAETIVIHENQAKGNVEPG